MGIRKNKIRKNELAVKAAGYSFEEIGWMKEDGSFRAALCEARLMFQYFAPEKIEFTYTVKFDSEQGVQEHTSNRYGARLEGKGFLRIPALVNPALNARVNANLLSKPQAKAWARFEATCANQAEGGW